MVDNARQDAVFRLIFKLWIAFAERHGDRPAVHGKLRFLLPAAGLIQLNIVIPKLAQDRVVVFRELRDGQFASMGRAIRQQHAQNAARDQQHRKRSRSCETPAGMIPDGLLGAILPRKLLLLLLVGVADIQAVQAEKRQIQPDPVPEQVRGPLPALRIGQPSAVRACHTQAEKPFSRRCTEPGQQQRLQQEHRAKRQKLQKQHAAPAAFQHVEAQSRQDQDPQRPIDLRVKQTREESLPREMLLRERIALEHALCLHFIEIRPCVERPELRVRLPDPSGDLPCPVKRCLFLLYGRDARGKCRIQLCFAAHDCLDLPDRQAERPQQLHAQQRFSILLRILPVAILRPLRRNQALSFIIADIRPRKPGL